MNSMIPRQKVAMSMFQIPPLEVKESDSSLDVGTKQWDLDELCRDSEFMCPPVCDSTTPDLENLSFEFELDKQQQYM